MPVVDTEVLFAFNPNDFKHRFAMNFLSGRNDLFAPDTAILEFQLVLRGRGTNSTDIKAALFALHAALVQNQIKEVHTLSSNLLILQCEIEEKKHLSYFDSLIAASGLLLDHVIISDDEMFDRVEGLQRIPLKL